MIEYYNYIKALHLIFIITWFAGLFYTPRLFIYILDAQKKPDLEKKILTTQLNLMSKRLWYIITWPSAILAIFFAVILIYLVPSWLMQQWMLIKLVFATLLIIYHLKTHSMYIEFKNGNELSENTFATAATWLACGLDPEKTIFFRQSAVSQVTELAWFLSCFFPFQRLTLAHSFKDKSNHLGDVNAGLFTYPMLMASDILIYDAELIPVGKDQLQHIEMTRDVASRFNHQLGKTFVLPKAKIQENTQYVIGTDGNKMSKSKNNTINIFLPEKKLRSQIMGIKTDSKSVNEPKNPDECILFEIYSILGDQNQVNTLRQKYIKGEIGYGDSKQALFELIMEKFKLERVKFNYYSEHPEEVEVALAKGANKASKIADEVLLRVRKKLGF